LSLNAHVHPVTHGQLQNPQHTYIKRAICKVHFKLYRAFKVILIGTGLNPEHCVVVICN